MSFLTPRLFSIAKMINIEEIVADIGTDHAYLPIYLAKDNKAKKIFACDINKNPLEIARNNINSFGVADKIELVLSDGIQWLIDKPEIHIDECIIAGVGSGTIMDILMYDSKQIDCYILASQTSLSSIRRWTKKNKYFIEQEEIILDNEVVYEIIKINKFAGTKVKNEEDILFGPILRRNINKIFIDKWLEQEDKLKTILSQIPRDQKRYLQLKKDLKFLSKFVNKELLKYSENKS